MKNLYKKITQYSEAFVALLLFLLFTIFLLQIFMRYIVDKPLSWTLEACIIAYVWIIFWGSSLILKFNEQVCFSVVYEACSPKSQKIFKIISYFILSAIFIYATPTIIDYILFMSLERSDALHIRKDILYSVFGLFIILTALRGIRIVYKELRNQEEGDK
ncbi:MAG: TRAP transporter small permease [Alphaproteobacteria bacterium]